MLVKRSSMFRFQLIKWFSSFHKYVLIKSNGRLMHNLLGHNMLLLENVGRKTSQIHQTPLLYIKSSESTFLTVGSFGGHPKHPAWFLNIKDIKKTNLIVKGKKKLSGVIKISGSKNATLPILAASILNKNKIEINRVPVVKDVITMVELLKHIGSQMILSPHQSQLYHR